MGKKYRHLTEQDRDFLCLMLQKGYKKGKIAAILGVHRSTVYREIKRNIFVPNYIQEKIYHGWHAQSEYLSRRKRKSKLICKEGLRTNVHQKLAQGWSPWQIEGRLREESNGQSVISHETIYRYIYSAPDIRNQFYKKLRRKHFYRKKRNERNHRIPKEMHINQRPECINKREEFGHWECDLMMFKQGIKANLITLRERKTRYMIAIKNENKEASKTAINLISTITKLKKHIKSITFDQGSEFLKYNWIKDCIGANIYFCEPASPYQKGCVENGNGVVRAEFPRDYNVSELSQKRVNLTMKEINDRPLKCLKYKTPAELFSEYI